MPEPEGSAPESPLTDVPQHPPLRDRTVLHRGRVFTLATERFDYGGHEITRELLDHPGAVAILALDDDERMLLIRQYRHPIRARDWEIPAGLLDMAGESPLAAAQRELAEEADLAAERWHLLAEFTQSPGGSDETMRIYLARGLSSLPAFDREEEEADIEVMWASLDDVVDGVLARRLQSPSTTVAALAAAAARARDWTPLADADTPWVRHPRLGAPPWRLPGDHPADDVAGGAAG